MAETTAKSHTGGGGGGGRVVGGGKLLRRSNSSRLRMHAPSSIQVEPPASGGCAASQWKLAIPLLSPLDMSPPLGSGDLTPPAVAASEISAVTTDEQRRRQQRPSIGGGGEGEDQREMGGDGGGGFRWTAWRHPAEPFYYEPVAPPANATAFLAPNCASSSVEMNNHL